MKLMRAVGACAVLGWSGVISAVEPRPPAARQEASQRAQQCFAQGDYLAAASMYEGLVAASPNDAVMWANLGVVRFRLDQLAEAADALERAVRLAPDDVYACCTLGIVYYRQSRYEQAERILRKAAQPGPQNATVHRFLAMVYDRQGLVDLARSEWGRVYELELPVAAPAP